MRRSIVCGVVVFSLGGVFACSGREVDPTALAESSVVRRTPRVGEGKKILFDAAHAQTAASADWVIDADRCGRAQRFPTPAPSTIDESSREDVWRGAFSAFGVALAKAGYDLESLPDTEHFTYGDPDAEQDLSKYDVLISPEPNTRFSDTEKVAIRKFVENGGGLFMIADHASADRNNDGWAAAGIFDDLMDGQRWGIHFQVVGESFSDITERHCKNYTTDESSPIIFTGPFGRASSKGFMLVASTVMTIDPHVNTAVRGHIWLNRTTERATKNVVVATSTAGAGRIAAVGDSSPFEDITASCGRAYAGFDDPTHDNPTILMNAVAWLSGHRPDQEQ